MIKSGISQIGGKYRLRKQLLELTPNHEFFLSLFSGACHYELNKPRCRYECFNDKNAEIINYLLAIEKNPKEFDDMKKGIFGLVSQEICNRIKRGKLQPKNNVEKAYFFYYLNKLTFPSTNGGYEKKLAKNITNKSCKNIKSQYRGITLPTVCKKKSVNEAKASYKGINPKTTRPFSNNDCGLLTPIDSNAIERLRYVNLTNYGFKKVYDLFYRAFHEKKGLNRECFIYADPPFPGTEKYYGNMFKSEEHQDLIEIMINSPFNFMLSIGGKCEFYIDILKQNKWIIKEVYTKYSTNANTQNEVKEYVCTNYNIKKLPKMIMDYQIDITTFGEVKA